MEIISEIRNRRSVRSYLAKPVEKDKLLRVLEAGSLAPSARNKQRWRYIVVQDAEDRRELMRLAYSQTFIADAPVILIACGVDTEYVMTCGQLAYPIDVSISIDHITLQAVAEGLGTCWIGKFDEKGVKKMLHIPDDVRVVELLTLGYPAENPAPTTRKSFEETIKFDRW